MFVLVQFLGHAVERPRQFAKLIARLNVQPLLKIAVGHLPDTLGQFAQGAGNVGGEIDNERKNDQETDRAHHRQPHQRIFGSALGHLVFAHNGLAVNAVDLKQ